MPISQLQTIRSMRFVHFKFQMSLDGACSHFRRNSTSFVFLMFCLFLLCTIARRSCYSLAYLRMLKWTMLGWESMSMDGLGLERILSWNRIQAQEAACRRCLVAPTASRPIRFSIMRIHNRFCRCRAIHCTSSHPKHHSSASNSFGRSNARSVQIKWPC